MRPFFKTILTLFIIGVGFISVPRVEAATKTICGTGGGCNYETLTAAFEDSPGVGDVFQIQGGEVTPFPYSSASESWPISFPNTTTTVECVGGAVIGQPMIGSEKRLYLSTGSTIQNCTFGHVQLTSTPSDGSVSPNGIVIQDNVFSTTVSSTIDLSSAGAVHFLIQGNSNINFLGIASSTDGIIQNNTFYGNQAGHAGGIILESSDTTSHLQFIGNTFTNYSPNILGSIRLLSLGGLDQTFASNTIRYAVDFPVEESPESSLKMTAAGTNYLGGNFIDSPNGSSVCSAVAIYTVSGQAWSGEYTISHNTIRRRPYCSHDGTPILYSTLSNRGDVSMAMHLNYNLFYNASSTVDDGPAALFIRGALTSLTVSNSYNGIYRFGANFISQIPGGGSSSITTDATTIYADPVLRLSDADTSNDLEVAPFSSYLDIVGSRDIGATNAARRNTISLDAEGVIDYSTVDATTTLAVGSFLRTGDTLTLASGVYPGFSINSAYATSSMTIQGAGASTILEGGVELDALTLSNVSSSHIANLVVRNASGVGSASYTATKVLARFGGTNYDEGFEMAGVNPSELAVFTNSSSCGSGPEFTPVAADGDVITAATFGGTTAFHLAALQIMGSHFSVLLPDAQFANQAALETFLSGACGLPSEAFTVDAFADNLFTVSGGEYAYDSSSLLSSGMTLVSGVTDPPAITHVVGAGFAGIKFSGNSNNNTVSGVISSNNGYGVRFVSTGDSYNTISDSVFSGNTYYDFIAGGNAYNTLDNDSFTSASSSVSGSGSLLVKYRARIHVTDADGGANLSGVAASSTDAGLTATSFGTTSGDGYTGYLRLPAYVIDAASHSLTNEGYNPYIFRTATLAGYSASSSLATLSSPDQVISIAAFRVLPAAPTGLSTSLVSTSTIHVSWTDNATNNSVTIFDFANEGVGATFPTAGITELSENAIGTDLVGLQPNGAYRFRVAARNAGGTSAYETSGLYYLLAETPSAPTLDVVSRTSLSIAVSGGENAASTEYAIYSPGLGRYLSAAGALASSSSWQTSSTWATLSISGLTCGTSYTFVAVARNHDGIETATSTSAVATTSACAESGTGGAATGGGGVGAVQTFFFPSITQPAPLTTSSGVIVVVPLVGEAPKTITSSLTTGGSTLAEFLRDGTTPASRSLGRGEREAIVRDMQEVLGVPADRLLVSDLELVAGGMIPRTRNLVYERSIAPRALATFRTMFGHAPNFRNANENLAWNTLMYRIRFPRDLSAERQGIVAFRRLFRVAPQSPFQWAAVRVLAYIR